MRKGCEKINRRLKEAIEKEGILVAAHRGTCGGNIIENTTDAYECAIKHRADIVEMDAVRSADGELFMFHDGNEKRLLGVDKNIKTMTSDEILSYDYLNQTWNRTAVKVNRLGDVFDYLKGRCLINLDRAENIFEYVIPEIEKRDMLDQIIIKSEPCDEVYDFLEKCKTPVMFMSKAMCADDIERTIERAPAWDKVAGKFVEEVAAGAAGGAQQVGGAIADGAAVFGEAAGKGAAELGSAVAGGAQEIGKALQGVDLGKVAEGLPFKLPFRK